MAGAIPKFTNDNKKLLSKPFPAPWKSIYFWLALFVTSEFLLFCFSPFTDSVGYKIKLSLKIEQSNFLHNLYVG